MGVSHGVWIWTLLKVQIEKQSITNWIRGGLSGHRKKVFTGSPNKPGMRLSREEVQS